MAYKDDQKDEGKVYMTLRQFTDKYKFKSYNAIRWQIYNNPDFNQKCVRRLGRTLLIDEKMMLDFIDSSRVKSK